MELCKGVRNKEELKSFKTALELWRAHVIPISEPISYQAMFLVERFCLSHPLPLADALIAATAVQAGLVQLTANTKHYSMVPELDVKRFKPAWRIRAGAARSPHLNLTTDFTDRLRCSG